MISGKVRKVVSSVSSSTKKHKVGKVLSIVAWNVNGIRACVKKEDGFFAFLKKHEPDVLCLTEIKCKDEDNPLLQKKLDPSLNNLLKQYHVYWNPGLKKKGGYSGTAIISKTEPLSVKMGLEGIDDLSDPEYEGRMVTVEFDTFYLVLTYVPNSGQKLERLKYRTETWDPAMLNHLEVLQQTKPVIWTGDLNVAHLDIDVHDPKGNRNKTAGFTDVERANFTKVLDKGFVDLYRSFHPEATDCFTYWSYRRDAKVQNKGWRLDYFVCSPELKDAAVSFEILKEQNSSDHCPIKLTMNEFYSE